jgi:hypothetical protein
VTREFCPDCGTHLLSRGYGLPGAVLIKVGTLDDPSVYGGPQMVIHMADKQAFHHVPKGILRRVDTGELFRHAQPLPTGVGTGRL